MCSACVVSYGGELWCLVVMVCLVGVSATKQVINRVGYVNS